MRAASRSVVIFALCFIAISTFAADYAVDPIRDAYREHAPFEQFVPKARTHFVKSGVTPDGENTRAYIRVRLLDGRRLVLLDERPVELRSVEEGEAEAALAALLHAVPSSARWYAASTEPEERIVDDWRKAEAFWQETLPDPRSAYMLAVDEADLDDVAFSLSQLPVVKFVDVAEYTTDELEMKPAHESSGEGEEEGAGQASLSSGGKISADAVAAWMAALEIDKVHSDMGVVGWNTSFVMATMGVPVPAGAGFPSITALSSYGPFAATGADNNGFALGAIALPKAAFFCVRVSAVSSPEIADFAGGLAVLVGRPNPMIYASDWSIVLRPPGTSLPIEYDANTFFTIRNLVGAGKTVVTISGNSNIDLADLTKYPPQAHNPFFADSGAIMVRSPLPPYNVGARINFVGPTTDAAARYHSATLIGISAALVESALQRAGQSVPGTTPQLNGGSANRNLPLQNSRMAVRAALDRYAQPMLRVQTNAPDHALVIAGSSWNLPEIPQNFTRIEGLRVYNDGKAALTVTATMQAVTGADNTACVPELSTGSIASGKAADLNLRITPKKPGDYRCRLRLEVNDPRVPLEAATNKRIWTADYAFRVPARPGSEMRVEDYLGNRIASGDTFDFGVLAATTSERNSNRVIVIHNEAWADRALTINVPAVTESDRFYLAPVLGIVRTQYQIEPGESKAFSLVVRQKITLNGAPQQSFDKNVPISTNDSNASSFTFRCKVTLKNLTQFYEIIAPHGYPGALTDPTGRWAALDIGEISINEASQWTVKNWGGIRSTIDGLKAKLDEIIDPIDAITELSGDKDTKTIGGVTRIDKILNATEIVDVALNVLVRPPGVGRIRHVAALKVQPPGQPEADPVYLYLIGTIKGNGPARLLVLGPGGTQPLRDGGSSALRFESNAGPAIPQGGTLAFGSVQVGSSVSRELTLLNNGNTAMTVRGIWVNGGMYSVTLPNSTIPPGTSVAMTVTLSGARRGDASSRLSFYIDGTNETDNFFTVNLSGSVCEGSNCGSSVPIINSFTATPGAVDTGQSATLAWNVTNATSISISQGVGTVTAVNSRVVTPTVTTDYVLTAANGAETVTRTVRVTKVGDGPPGSPSIASFRATPESVNAGQSTTLSWTVTGATSLSLSPGGPVTGTSITVTPATTTTYILSATNSSGTSTRAALVTLGATTAPVVDTFTATPDLLSAPGDESLLEWDVSNANTVSISPSIGPVSPEGERTVTPSVTTLYTLTATNSAGTTTRQQTVRVQGTNAGGEPPRIQSFTASSTSSAAGVPVTLSWNVENADKIILAPPLTVVNPAESRDVSSDATTTYTLFARNSEGSVSQEITVSVAGGPPVPSINEFIVQPQPVVLGGGGEIRWNTSGASNVSIGPDLGTVATSGVKSIRPGVDSVIVLKATNAAGSVSKAAVIDVERGTYEPLTRSLEVLQGTSVETGIRLEHEKTSQLYDPLTGYTAGSIPLLIVNRSQGNITLSRAWVDNPEGGEIFSLSTELKDVTLAPDQAVPLMLRWSTPLAPRGYRVRFHVSPRTNNTTGSNHTFLFHVPEWGGGAPKNFDIVDGSTPIGYRLQEKPFDNFPSQYWNIGLVNASATATKLFKVRNRGTAPLQVSQAWCSGDRWSIRATPPGTNFPLAIPANGEVTLRVTVTSAYTSTGTACVVHVQTPGEPVTEGAFAGLSIYASGLSEAPSPLVLDGNNRFADDHTSNSNAEDVVTRLRPNRRASMVFKVKNGNGYPLRLNTPISITGSGFRLARGYYAGSRTIQPLLTVNEGLYDEAHFKVEFTGKGNGTYTGVIKLPMWGSANNALPAQWEHTFEIHWRVVVGTGRAKVAQGQTELDNGGGFDADDATVFTITNTSDGTLNLSGLAVPPHYTIGSALPRSLGAGQSGSFSATRGNVQAGEGPHFISFNMDDPDDPIFQVVENHKPVAVPDASSVNAGEHVAIDVTLNDTDPDGDAVSLSPLPIVTPPTKGIVVETADNVFVYTANADATGSDRFLYEVSDGNGGVARAEVLVTIGAENHNPVANPDSATTRPNTPVTIDVVANDVEPDGDPILLIPEPIVVAPTNGVAEKVDGARIQYTPNTGFTGTDTFTYEIGDTFGKRARAVVTVSVIPNTKPVANPDSASTLRSQAVKINVTGNDTDADGDSLSLVPEAIVIGPSNGAAVRTNAAEITYTPTAGFVGIDTFTYEIGDGHGARARALVTVTIANFGPPVARNDRAYTQRNTPVTINVLENDIDPDGQTIALTANAIRVQPGHGSVVRASATSVTYTPFSNYAGNDAFQYEIVDAVGKKDKAWVTVHVGRTRLAPIAADDAAETPTNQSRSLDVLANDSSPDGDAIRLTAAPFLELPRWGTVARISDTVLAYTAKNGFVGTDRFRYQITDTEGRKGSAWVTMTVTRVNEKPVAVADSASTHMNQPVTIDVTANDSDPDGDDVSLIPSPIVTAPQHGYAVRVSASSIAYAPAAGFSGTDAFEYEISDGNGRRARALVNVSVSDTNHPPEAEDDTATTAAGTLVTINVTANDSDPDGDNVSLIVNPIITAPTRGTATKINADEITYRPQNGFTGTDTFQYEVGDGHGGRHRAVVTITVGEGEVNHNPVAVADNYTARVSTPIELEVTENDTDPDGDNVNLITNAIITAPAHGTAVRVNGHVVRYTPQNGYVGIDNFQYEIGDGRGKRSRAWVRVTVENANSRPVAVNDVASTRPNTPVTVRVIANDYDPDGDPVHITANGLLILPEHGTAVNSGGHSILYTPDAGYRGTDRVKYQIGDGRGLRATAWLNIQISGNGGGGASAQAIATLSDTAVAPIADNDLGEGITDAAVPVVVLANDITIDGRSVVLAAEPVITQPESGTVTRTSDTTLTFTPAAGFRGNDRFEYEVVDSAGTTTRAWAAVQIPGTNQPPVAEPDVVTIAREASFVIRPLLNDSDPDNDPLSLSLRAMIIPPQHGVVRRDGNHEIVYQPEPGFTGDDVFTYEISDERGGLDQATVTIQVLNATNPPTAANDTGSGESGKPIAIDVLANDADPDGEPLRISASTRPLHGSIVWSDEGGTVTYHSVAGYTGTDRFTYTISDTDGLTAQAEVTVTVIAVNAPPILADDVAETTTRTPVLIGVLANDWDPEWRKLVITAVTTPSGGTATIYRGQAVNYEPGPNFAGTDTFQYTVSDGGTGRYSASVTVTVLNAPPLPRSEILSAPEDTAVGYQSYNVLGNDTDPDGDELHIADVEQPSHGTFQISPDKQQFSFKGPENWFGMVTFHYTVSDPFGATVRVMSQISVSPVNDAPVAVNDTFPVYKNQLLTIPQASVVGNDTDIEGHTIRIYSIGAPTNGTVQLLPDGSIEYRPYGEHVGTDSFEYIIEDHAGGAYGTGRININVLQDTRPVANFTFSCTNLVCAFDASSSTDDRGIVLYQWTMGNNSAASGKTFSYTYGSVGTYAVRLTVQDVLGQTHAVQKTVIVTCPLPAIQVQPTSRAVTAGQPTTLSVTSSNATGYQWYQGAAGVTTFPVGTNLNTLTVTPAATATYWVRVRNTCGDTDSAVATVTVCTPPGIATQPASQTVNSGTAATLTVAASGTGPFTYQWYEGASGTATTPVGTNSTSFTTPTLTVARSYWVRVTSACNGGVANSNTATVSVTAIQIARRQKAAQVANSQQSITASWTQPTQQGSLLVAVVSALGNGGYPIATFTPPAGWIHAVTSEWSNVKTSIYYYPNHPGGRTAETFATGPTGFRDQILQIAEYTGMATASPLDRTATAGNSTNTGQLHTGNTLTTVQGRELVITSLMANAPATFSSPTDSFTEIHDHTITWSHLATAMHERIVSATGIYGHSATVDTPGTEWVGAIATFKAAN